MIARRDFLKASLLAGTVFARLDPLRESHREADGPEVAPLALLAVGRLASRVDTSWLKLGGETRLSVQPCDAAVRFRLRAKPLMRLVLADSLEKPLVDWLMTTRVEEPEVVLVVVSRAPASRCRFAAQSLGVPVLKLYPGSAYEDAVRAWFNPLAISGPIGFYSEDVESIAAAPATGWVVGFNGLVSSAARWCARSADSWLLHISAVSFGEINAAAGDLQQATINPDAHMLFASVWDHVGVARGALATMERLQR